MGLEYQSQCNHCGFQSLATADVERTCAGCGAVDWGEIDESKALSNQNTPDPLSPRDRREGESEDAAWQKHHDRREREES